MDKLDMILNELQDIKKSLKIISNNQISTSKSLKDNFTSENYNQNTEDTKDKL